VYASAISAAGATLTIDAQAYAADFDLSGVANVPTLAGSAALDIYGNTVLPAPAALTLTYTGTITWRPPVTTTKTVSINGQTLLSSVVINGAGTLQLSQALVIGGAKNFTRTAGTFAHGGQDVSFVGIAHTITGVCTWQNLTRTGTAASTDSFTMADNQTIVGTLTINGSAANARMFFKSSSDAAVRVITAAVVSVSNINIAFIQGAGAGNWNIAGCAGLAGDGGGNVGITFDAAQDQYWHVDSGSFSNAAKWFRATDGGGGAGRVPLPQDTVHFDDKSIDNDGQTITFDEPVIGYNITFSGVLHSPTIAAVAGNYSWLCFGATINLTGVGSMTGSSSQVFNFWYVGTTTLTTGGVTIGGLFNVVSGNTLLLGDDCTGNNVFYNIYGTVDLNYHNLTQLCYAGGGSAYLYLRTGTLTLSGTSGSPTKFSLSGASFHMNAGTGTIVLTNSGATGQTFAGAGYTFYNLVIQGAGNYSLTMTGNNTFNRITVDRSVAAKTIVATGTVQTVAECSIPVSGTRVVTITGGTWTFNTINQMVSDYLTVSNSTANGANKWFAGTHGTDGGGNTRWVFGNPKPKGNKYIRDMVSQGCM
jgi:hypothetical protein